MPHLNWTPNRMSPTFQLKPRWRQGDRSWFQTTILSPQEPSQDTVILPPDSITTSYGSSSDIPFRLGSTVLYLLLSRRDLWAVCLFLLPSFLFRLPSSLFPLLLSSFFVHLSPAFLSLRDLLAVQDCDEGEKRTITDNRWCAAEELKKQAWRFHKQYLTWFQRAASPTAVTDDYEQGPYTYFDWENVWCQRRKTDFRFEVSFYSDSPSCSEWRANADEIVPLFERILICPWGNWWIWAWI